MAKQSTTTIAQSTPSVSAQNNSFPISNSQSNPPQQQAVNPNYPVLSAQAVNGSLSAPHASFNGQSSGIQIPFNMPPMPQFGALPPPPPVAGLPKIDPALEQQIKLLQYLAENGVPQDQWAGIIGIIAQSNVNSTAVPPTMASAADHVQPPSGWNGPNQEDVRNRSYQEANHNPNDSRSRRRSRSISPQRAWNSRDDRGYDDFDHGQDSHRGGRTGDRGRGRGNDYRQRSPPRRGRTPTPPRWDQQTGAAEKFVEYDSSIPEGHIKGWLHPQVPTYVLT